VLCKYTHLGDKFWYILNLAADPRIFKNILTDIASVSVAGNSHFFICVTVNKISIIQLKY